MGWSRSGDLERAGMEYQQQVLFGVLSKCEAVRGRIFPHRSQHESLKANANLIPGVESLGTVVSFLFLQKPKHVTSLLCC